MKLSNPEPRPARELRASLVSSLRHAVRELLIALDVPSDAVQREIVAMEPVALAKAVAGHTTESEVLRVTLAESTLGRDEEPVPEPVSAVSPVQPVLSTARERPAPGILDTKQSGTPAPTTAAPVGRHEKCAQSGKAIGIDYARSHQLGQRFFDLRAQQPGALDQFIEERRAVLANAIGDVLRAGTQSSRVGGRGQ